MLEYDFIRWFTSVSWVDTEPSHPFYKQEMILVSYVGENWVLKLNSLSLQ